MDLGTLSGLIALAMSAVSLWLGWRSDNATRRRMEDFTRTNERQSGQIESLIEQVGASTKQSDELIELVKRLIDRI